MPYLAYDQVEFDVVVGTYGDTFDRYAIRLNEIRESMRIVRQILDRMPPGDYRVQDKKVTPPPRARIDESMEALIHHFKIFTEGFRVPEGEVYVAVESPRGELGCYLVSDGSAKPYRMHIRGPSLRQPADAAPHAARAASSPTPWPSSRASTRSWARSTGSGPSQHRRTWSWPGRSIGPLPAAPVGPHPPAARRPGAGRLAQPDAMEHIAELLDLTPAEVLGTASFYEMFKREPVGRYLVDVCTNISCLLLGGDELLEHCEERARDQGGGHHRRRAVHPRGGGVHRRLHRGALPPGQLPLLHRRHPRGLRPAASTTCGPAARTTRSRPTAPPPGCASRSPPTAGPAAAPRASRWSPMSAALSVRTDRAPAGDRAQRRRWPMSVTDGRRAHRVVAVGPPRRPHPRRATAPPAATRGLRKALDMGPEAVVERGQGGDPPGPGRRRLPGRARSGASSPRTSSPATSSSTATRASRAPTRTACSWSATPTSSSRASLIAAFADRAAQAFLYVRGEMALAQERLAAALNEAYAAGLVGQEHPRAPAGRIDVVLHWGAGAYIVGEETALLESLEGKRGMPRLKPPVLPGGQGPLPAADDRQQRRDAVEPAVDRRATAAPPSPPSAPRGPPAPALFACPAT